MSERIRIPGPSAHLDFLIIGAMKAGSISLLEFLAAHPSVFVPQNREPQYFSMRYHYSSFYYRWLFRARRPQHICGEASTSYSDVNEFPQCPERIANDAPNARIIYVIRDPVERILSNLRYLRLRGHEINIDSKVVTDNELWNKSRYRDTIDAYLDFFPRSRLFVADLHELNKDEVWLRRILSFLKLDPSPYDKLALKQLDDIGIPGISAEVLRKRFPDLCDELDSQYQWARTHFIDLPEDPVTGNSQPAEPEPEDFRPLSMQTDVKPEAKPMEPAALETAPAVTSTGVTTDPVTEAESVPRSAEPTQPTVVTEPEAEAEAEIIEPREAANADVTAATSNVLAKWQRSSSHDSASGTTNPAPEPESVPEPAEPTPPPVDAEPETEITEPREAANRDKPASAPNVTPKWRSSSHSSTSVTTDPAAEPESVPEPTSPPVVTVLPEIQDSDSTPEVSVTFRFLKESWAEVSDARQRRIYDLKRPGAKSSFTGVLPLQVYLRIPAAAEIEVDGKEIQIPESALTPDGKIRFTIAGPEVETTESREAATRRKPDASSNLLLWAIFSIMALAGSFYLLIDDEVLYEVIGVSQLPQINPQAGSAEPEVGPEVSVTFRFVKECWTEISDARGRRIYNLKKPGEESSFTAELPLKVFLGNPSAVVIKVNGKPFQIPASADFSAGTARFTIEENDIN